MSNSLTAPAERELGFLGPGDHLGNGTRHHSTEHLRGHLEEHVTVRRITRRRGGDHPHRGHLMVTQQLGVGGQRRLSAGQRFGRESPCGVDTLAETDDPHLAMHVTQSTVDHVGDEQPNRVGAAVDGATLIVDPPHVRP